MCINLGMNESKVILLGMKEINESMKTENAVMMMAEKLSEFGLNLKEHIVEMVTDGTAIMEKTGRLSEVLHQICHSHGIHLAVIDVLFKKNNADEHEDEIFHSETIHEVTANEEWKIDDNAQITREKSLNDSEDHDLELREQAETFINKIQTVVRIFCRSSVKNDVLQKDCEAEFNLIMDTQDSMEFIAENVVQILGNSYSC